MSKNYCLSSQSAEASALFPSFNIHQYLKDRYNKPYTVEHVHISNQTIAQNNRTLYFGKMYGHLEMQPLYNGVKIDLTQPNYAMNHGDILLTRFDVAVGKPYFFQGLKITFADEIEF